MSKFWLKSRIALGAILLLLAAVASVRAVEPDEVLPNSQLEARARAISAEIRCPVCQGENIDNSAAPLAHDLRVLVRQRLLAGDTDSQVLDFVTARYGSYILLKPPFDSAMLLWLFPPLLFMIAAAGLIFARSRTKKRNAARRAALKALTPQEREKLRDILSDSIR